MNPRLLSSAAAITTVAMLLTSCASNPYAPWYKPAARYDAYEAYRPTPIEIAQMRVTYESIVADAEANPDKQGKVRRVHADNIRINPYLPYTVTDRDIVSYADHVRAIFTSKFTNARFARYTSSTVQVLLAGGAGVAAAFSGGTALIAGLAFGSAVTPEVGKIFNAKDRANIYMTSAHDIDNALNDFALAINDGTPSNIRLTSAGRDLVAKVYTAIEKTETFLSGNLPDLQNAEQTAAYAKAVSKNLSELSKATRELTQELKKTKSAPSPSPTQAPTPAKSTSADNVTLPAAEPANTP